MPRFDEYLASLGTAEGGGIVYPEDFMTQLNSAYTDDFQGATATIALKDAEIAELKAQNTQLAAANWNLLQSVPTNGEIQETPNEPENTDPDDDSDDPDPSDFFSTKEGN